MRVCVCVCTCFVCVYVYVRALCVRLSRPVNVLRALQFLCVSAVFAHPLFDLKQVRAVWPGGQSMSHSVFSSLNIPSLSTSHSSLLPVYILSSLYPLPIDVHSVLSSLDIPSLLLPFTGRLKRRQRQRVRAVWPGGQPHVLRRLPCLVPQPLPDSHTHYTQPVQPGVDVPGMQSGRQG